MSNANFTLPDPSIVNSKKRWWRTGLLLVSSAALGGIAVALWDRAALTRLRHRQGEGPEEEPGSAGEG